MFELKPTSAQAKSKGGVFPQGRILIGRNESCDLIVTNDSISAIHAVMEIFASHAVIYDMNSTNGTFVNDDKIIAKEIHIGDTFRLADVEFTYKEYSPLDSLPPVLDVLEPSRGEAAVRIPPAFSRPLPSAPKSLPRNAPSISNEMPSIVYPLTADPRAEFSEYIFEDKQELYPIFKYEVARQAVEVIILFKDQIFSIDYLAEGENTYYISGVLTKNEELEFPYLGKTERFPFVEVRGAFAVVHTLPGFGVFLLSDRKKDTGHVGTDIELHGQDILRLQKGDIQIFVRNVQAPPKIAPAPILKRDPEFRKYLALFLFCVSLLTVGFNVIEVPVDEKKNEEAPERIAMILYKQRLTVSENPLVDKTEKAPNRPQQSPKQTAVEKPKNVEPNQPDIKTPDVITTPDQSKKQDPGKSTELEKKIVKQGTTPVTRPDNRIFNSPVAKSPKTSRAGAKSPSAFSPVENKSLGNVEVYKSADFSSSVSSLVAKGGSLSGVKTGVTGTGGNSSLVGAASGVLGGTGKVQTSTMVTNQGSLVGAASGVLGNSKGAEGLSAKRMIYTAGIPNNTIVLGSMDPDLIRRRLMEFLPQFRSCYQRELDAKGSEINGTIKLNFVIGSTGHVAKAGIDGSTPLPPDVSACVVNVLRGIVFPEPLGGGTVEVKQPMNFQPKKL